MGTYYYIKDKKSEGGFRPVYEDDYIQTIFSVVKKHGLKINNTTILKELKIEKFKRSKKSCKCSYALQETLVI